MKFLKILLISILVVSIGLGIAVYLNRHTIFDYSINNLLLNLLPEYITIEDIAFDFDAQTVTVKGFKIDNPPGYKHANLLEVPTLRCRFSQKNPQQIKDGVRIGDPQLYGPTLYIDRLKDSKLNVQEMEKVFSKKKIVSARSGAKRGIFGSISYLFSPIKKLEQLVTLDTNFKIHNGTFVFDDASALSESYVTTVEGISANIGLKMGDEFKDILYIDSTGFGLVNGIEGQRLDWVSGYDPTREKLTMSNTFNVRDVDFTHFSPYYSKFSPFVFKKGKISGKLIFNFDNGDIGSTNELWLSDLQLEESKDDAKKHSWMLDMVTIDDLYKYFASSSGDIAFDFKIKGSMDNPKFYLGSKTKRALIKMSANKLIDTIFGKEEEGGTEPAQEQEKSDIERIVDIFKSFD